MAQNGSPMALSPTASQPAPMTKRAKRRKNITEKLAEMVFTFGKDQHQHYRAQLQAIQVDMTLIMRADPYENASLDDSPQAIEEHIEAVTGGNMPNEKGPRDDYIALAGKRYGEYAQLINQAMEQRDADLVALKNYYDSANAELERNTSYKIQVAQREHVELASTVRQRLINSVTKKRDRLLRDKEQLDIADSNSMFLHPSHFVTGVPGSPGGAQSHRKTRHTRHRLGDPEEPVSERGRKRKAGDDDAIDSPVPSFRPLNDGTGGNSPFSDSRAKTLYTQYEAPAFSIERLFTEKELSHASTVAQFATHNFFHQQQLVHESAAGAPHTNGHSTSVPSFDAPADVSNGAANANTEDEATGTAPSSGTPPPSQPQATDMERTVSYHATRGATKANPLSFLSDAAAAMSADVPINRFQPALVPITKTDKGAPTPPSMTGLDVDSDLALMCREIDEDIAMGNTNDRDDSVHNILNKYLEQATRDPIAVQPFRLPLTEVGPAAIEGGVNRIPQFGFADPASITSALRNGGANATAPTSAANLKTLAAALGNSVGGGLPMSRATSMGGSEVGGSEAGGAGMRRTRNRLI